MVFFPNWSPHVIELIVTVRAGSWSTGGRLQPLDPKSIQPIDPNAPKRRIVPVENYPDENTVRLDPRAREEHGLTKDPATFGDWAANASKVSGVANIKPTIGNTTYSSIWAQDEPLTLQHAAAISPDGAKFKYVGRWFSKSYYLGNTANSDYYVKNLDRHTPDAQLWTFRNSSRFENPVGFFFDDDKDKPFLVLSGFNATSFTIFSQGIGLLLRSYSSVQAAQTEVAWRGQEFNPAGRYEPEAPAR
jgi:hypothetical protein